ncbi:hypothetical protein ACU8KO_002656 [Vibrio alginolyticus]
MEIETQITIELIKAGGNVLTAAIPSVVSFYLGRKLMNSAKLKEDLKVALSDIRFLLAVEELHCREHKELEGQSKHLTMRKSVKAERQLDWSGKFSLSRITKKLEKLQ